MVHRRIPKKNRKKLKSVDPFNKKAAGLKSEEGKNKNKAPEKFKGEDQPLTKALQQVLAKDEPLDKTALKKKKKQKNAVLQEAEKLGLKKGRFETVERFVKRCEATMHRRIKEDIVFVKQGLAGRSKDEIDADYAKIEEAEKRRKDQERREVENKIKEAKKKRDEVAKRREEIEAIKEQRKALKRKLEEEEEEVEEVAEEEVAENSDDDEDDSDDDDAVTKKKKTTEADETVGKRNVKMSKKERRKETLKNRRAEEQQRKDSEAIFNGKEVIEFGERYDAPPVFAGHLKKKFEPLLAKAGQKTLLLHSILSKSDEKTKYLDTSTTTIHEERQKVIDAYRQFKKNRRLEESS